MNGQDIKQEVQQATDIVRLIGEHVALRPRGKEFVGLCPFHDDKRPSLNVSPAKQIYKCFSCGEGGDVFSFVMEYHKMGFRDALQHLAERANITLPKFAGGPDDPSSGPSPRQRIAKANEQAQAFFRRVLQDPQHGRIARDYLAERGISDDMIGAFGIGYAPDRWDGMVEAIGRRGWDRRAFAMAGLIADRSSGDGQYDRFRHRLMFPICDGMGRPIAFGGRVLDGGTIEDKSDAKYLNSPETPLFNKSATLFGLHLARKPIIDSRTAVVVEGYTDVIACHQAGLGNVVATLGTALTDQHAQPLRPLCDRVVLVFDADEAGQRAADRAVEVFFREPLDVCVAVLPDRLDPADLLAQDDGAERWAAVIERAADAMQFQFQRFAAQFEAIDTLAGRRKLAEQYLQLLGRLGFRQLDPMRRAMVIPRLADLLRLSPEVVDDLLRRASATGPAGQRGAAEATSVDAPPSPRTLAERQIVGCLLEQSEAFEMVLADGRPLQELLSPDDLTDPAARSVFAAILDRRRQSLPMHTGDLRVMLDDEMLIRQALDWAMDIERTTDGRADRIESLLQEAAGAVLRGRAEHDYQEQVSTLRNQAAQQQAQDAEAERLALAVAHRRAHPSTGRIPRIRN